MRRNILFWLLAFLITLLTAYYQRTTGPTYPISGEKKLNQSVVKYKLFRSHGGITDHRVSVETEDPEMNGILVWKRFKTEDPWTEIEMIPEDNELYAMLPNQPPAGKLEYYIKLSKEEQEFTLPSDNTVVIRFKGDVPLTILILHVIAMFGAMLLSNRTGLEYFSANPNLKKLTYWTIGFLFVGGFILGPIVQKYAFGEFWTGFPFGYDLTDNKTLIAMIGWIIAAIMYQKSKRPKLWALAAAILLLIVYMIPHSVLGSELDYSKLDNQQVEVNTNYNN